MQCDFAVAPGTRLELKRSVTLGPGSVVLVSYDRSGRRLVLVDGPGR